MGFDEVCELTEYWHRYPPTAINVARIDAMIAAYLGVKRDTPQVKPRSYTTAEQSKMIVARFGGHNGR